MRLQHLNFDAIQKLFGARLDNNRSLKQFSLDDVEHFLALQVTKTKDDVCNELADSFKERFRG